MADTTDVLVVPCRPDLTHYTLRTELDGATYSLEFRWNTREEAWYMHVRADDGTEIIDSVKIVVGWPLGARVVDVGAPPGVFTALDSSGLSLDPGIADLGDRVRLVYVPVANLP